MSGKHLVFVDRLEMEQLYGDGVSIEEIAVRLKTSQSTVYNELRRGDTGEMDRNGRIGYSAELAQRKIIQNYRKRRAAQA